MTAPNNYVPSGSGSKTGGGGGFSMWSSPSRQAQADRDKNKRGLFGTPWGPNFDVFGAGKKIVATAGGLAGLAYTAGSALTPSINGWDPIEGPGAGGLGDAVAGIGSGVGGTFLDVFDTRNRYSKGGKPKNPRGAGVLGQLLEKLPGDATAEQLTPITLDASIKEQGYLGAIVDLIGNIAIVGGAITAPAKAASLSARAAAASARGARLPTAAAKMSVRAAKYKAVAAGLDANPGIYAMKHPYRITAATFRQGVMKPANQRILAAQGIADVPLDQQPVGFLADDLPDNNVNYAAVERNPEESAANAAEYRAAPDDVPEYRLPEELKDLQTNAEEAYFVAADAKSKAVEPGQKGAKASRKKVARLDKIANEADAAFVEGMVRHGFDDAQSQGAIRDGSADPPSSETGVAYAALNAETAPQYHRLTAPVEEGGHGITVEFVDEAEPYASKAEMAEDIRKNRHLKVAKTKPGTHSRMTPQENDRFRAVHDAYGHGATGRDFARGGEEAAYIAHSGMYSKIARRAMAAETRGQNAVLLEDGAFPTQKAFAMSDEGADAGPAIKRAQQAAPRPGDRILASLENTVRGREAHRMERMQERMLEAERQQVLHSPAIKALVKIAQNHLIQAAKDAGLPRISRKEAELIVGEEIHNLLNGRFLTEDLALHGGVSPEKLETLGIRRHPVPKGLRTKAFEDAIQEASDRVVALDELNAQILDAGRPGPLKLDDPMEPKKTKTQKKDEKRADALREKATGAVQARKIATDVSKLQKIVISTKDQLGTLAHELWEIAQKTDQALADFQLSRKFTPKAWRTAGAMEKSAAAIHARTLAELDKTNGVEGGASYDPHTGRFLEPGKDTGYSVGLLQGTAMEVPLEQFTPENIEHVIRAYQELFIHKDTVVGTWVDDGTVYIDISEIVPDIDDAMIRGASRGQLSIFDMLADKTFDGILLERADVAQQFLKRNHHLKRIRSQLRDLVGKTQLTAANVGVITEMHMRWAVSDFERGSISHPDVYFKNLKRVEFATKASPNKNALRQIFLDRGVSMALWDEMAPQIADMGKVQAWYFRSNAMIHELFDGSEVTLLDGVTKIDAADLVFQLLAATSVQKGPRDNFGLALNVFKTFDELPEGEFLVIKEAMEKVVSGKATMEDAFKVVRGSGVAEVGAGLIQNSKQYVTEILTGHTIDKWTPESLSASSRASGAKKPKKLDRAKALEAIRRDTPELLDRLTEDQAVREFYAGEHRAKIMNFMENLRDPENSMMVTIDFRMEHLLGIKKNDPGEWIRVSQEIRALADELTAITGTRVMPHEVQAVMWVFAKEEIGRLQTGHFAARAFEASANIGEGKRLDLDADSITEWLDEIEEPYIGVKAKQDNKKNVTRPIMRGNSIVDGVPQKGTVADESIHYRPEPGPAKTRRNTITTWRATWEIVKARINKKIDANDIEGAQKIMSEYHVQMLEKTLKIDLDGGDFMHEWMNPDRHLTAKGEPTMLAKAAKALSEGVLKRLNQPIGVSELGALAQSGIDKILGEYIPLSGVVRGIIRVFEGGNMATFAHESGHLLKTLLPDAERRMLEGVYGPDTTHGNRQWTRASQERFANDILNYFTLETAPPGLETTFAAMRVSLGEIWELVDGTFMHRRVHPDIKDMLDDWLNPARQPTVPEAIPGRPDIAPEKGSLLQRASRKPKLGDAATPGDYYQSGRKGQKAISEIEKLAARKRTLEAAEASAQQTLADVEHVLETGKVPARLEADDMLAEARRIEERIADELRDPSSSNVPRNWGPVLDAMQDLARLAAKDPELAALLEEIPQTLADIQALAKEKGFNPVHVREFTPKDVRRLVRGTLRLGKGGGLIEESAGARKKNTGALRRAGAVDKSIQAWLAASVEVLQERRTNNMVDWVENSAARTIEVGEIIPDGWVAWDSLRTRLLTGEVVSEGVLRETAGRGTTRIIPKSVHDTLMRSMKDYDHAIFRGINRITSPWRTLVLTLSPGWYVRNIAGNMMMATAANVDLQDWQAAWKSYKTTDVIGPFADVPFVQGSSLANDGIEVFDSSIIPRSKGLEGARQAMSEDGRIKGLANHVKSRMLRVNQVVDEFSRAAVYHNGRRLNMSHEEAWHRASTAMVDYGNLSNFERRVVRSVLPFYSWQKGILKVTLGQFIDHPARTRLLLAFGQMHEEYLADQMGLEPEDIPDYYKQLIGDRNFRGYNPFSDAGDLLSPEGIARSLNPFLELAVRKGLGAPRFPDPNNQRIDPFGFTQSDVDVNAELGDLLTSSPGGRFITNPDILKSLGLQPQDMEKLVERFKSSRR